MKYLLIKNDGLLEVEALHLMGASTKRGDSTKIGMFGTGNKYALSYLLRKGYNIQLFSGIDEIAISFKISVFRSKEFRVIHINGMQTSLTTEMGIEWSLWQVLRELYCNALDEPGAKMQIVGEIKPQHNETHFYIPVNEEVQDFIKEYDKYFSFTKKVLFQNDHGKILEITGKGGNFYRKSIRCFENSKPSLYDYDFNEIAINENRVVEYWWNIHEYMWRLILSCNNLSIIRRIFLNLQNDMFIEGDLGEYISLTQPPSDAILEYCSDKELMPRGLAGLLTTEELAHCTIVPSKLFSFLREYLDESSIQKSVRVTSGGIMYRPIESTRLHSATIARARDFFKECKFEMSYEIIVARFDKKDTLGMVHEGKIVLADICLERGIQETVNTILEEYIHIKHNVKDQTRGFQTAAITEFIGYMKTQNAFVL